MTHIPLILGLGLLGLSACSPAPVESEDFTDSAVLEMTEALSHDDLQGRKVGTEGSEEAQELIIARFEALGIAPVGDNYQHPFTYGGFAAKDGKPAKPDKPGTNIFGRIEGKSGDRMIVISAHYDHVGVNDGEIYNGADDNASGVAGILAIAEYFAANQPENTIIFAAFDAEEDGFGGSRAFIRNPPIDKASIAFNLNLDMLARGDNGLLWASGVSHTPALKPIIEAVAAEAPIDLKMGFDSGDGRDDWTLLSDHAVFFRAGIPHLYLGVEDHADYHKPGDDFDKIDQDWFLGAVETALMVAKAIDSQLDGAIVR